MSVVSEHMSQDLLTVSAGDRLGEAAKRAALEVLGSIVFAHASKAQLFRSLRG